MKAEDVPDEMIEPAAREIRDRTNVLDDQDCGAHSPEAVEVSHGIARAALAAGLNVLPVECVMTRTDPFDFAQCETHDETFPLGERCKFYGREPADVYAQEADEQRARAVRAELAVEEHLTTERRLNEQIDQLTRELEQARAGRTDTAGTETR